MADEGRNFEDVLKEAQSKGYAERDPKGMWKVMMLVGRLLFYLP